MLTALRWSEGARSIFCGAVAPSLFEQPDFFRKALEVTECRVLEAVPRDVQRRFLELILAYFSEDHSISKAVLSYLAPDLSANRSVCVEWMRGGGSRGRIMSNIPESLTNDKDFWLELAPSVAKFSVARAFNNKCPFLGDEVFVMQAASICPDLLSKYRYRHGRLRTMSRGKKELAMEHDKATEGMFWILSDVMQHDVDVQVSALVHITDFRLSRSNGR